MRIVEVLNNPRSSAAHIAEVVGKDAGISAKLLRLVNSPFYGFPTRIDSLSRAVALIGANDLTTLALGISVVNHFKGVPDKLVDMKSFWLHSIACGVLARLFANKKIGLNEERFFVAGLLHDIAKLVLYQDLPEHMGKVLAKARMNSSCQFEIEKESMGFDHARLAETLLSEWKLPVPLQRMIRYHHSPPSGAGGLDSAIIHLADISAIGLMYGTSGQVTVPPLNTQAWDILEFGPGTISAAARQAERQIREIIKIFMR
jgi:HD-like signal output (HDOD) protein